MGVIVTEFTLARDARDVIEACVIQNRTALTNARTPEEISPILDKVWPLLPGDLRKDIEDFHSGKTDITVFRGGSAVANGEEVMPTPPRKEAPGYEEQLLYAPTMALFSALMNVRPVRTAEGTIMFNHVIPDAPQAKFDVHSTGRDLKMHVDSMYYREMPGVIGLFCNRGQEGANTRFIKIDDILSELDEETIAELRKPQFGFTEGVDLRARAGNPFGVSREGAPEVIDVPYSLLDGDKLRYSQDSIGLNIRAKQALEALNAAIKESKTTDINLQTGDIAFQRNDRLVHGRSPFEFTDNPAKKRWLMRMTGHYGLQAT